MCKIGPMIAPLNPRDQRQHGLHRHGPQRQHGLPQRPHLRHRQRGSFFSPTAASGATEKNAPASSSAYGGAVVLENNNGHLTRLSAEELPLFCLFFPQAVLVSFPRVGPGEPGSADERAAPPSA